MNSNTRYVSIVKALVSFPLSFTASSLLFYSAYALNVFRFQQPSEPARKKNSFPCSFERQFFNYSNLRKNIVSCCTASHPKKSIIIRTTGGGRMHHTIQYCF